MYQVPQFKEERIEAMHALIRANPLGLMISRGAEEIVANPVPFLLYEEGDKGVLRCHLSRGNPQWQALRDAPEALVVFQGIDRYITPNWYPSKTIDQRAVPTWNYAIVQARGRATVIEDRDWLYANVSALSDTHEADRPRPWSVSDAPPAYIAGQLKGIVGIEIVIERIEGKFKASQNRAAADRAGVVAGLEQEGDARSLAMRDMVKERNGL